VIVERVDPVGDVDVVAAESGRRLDPSGAEFEIGISVQKRKGQHLTGAVSHRRTGSIFTLIFGKNIAAPRFTMIRDRDKVTG
jgi:hypothetical protein